MNAAGWLVNSTTAPTAPLSLALGEPLGVGAGVGVAGALGVAVGEDVGDGLVCVGLGEGSAA